MSSSYRSALLAGAFGVAASSAAAAGWEFQPRIEVSALYDDNYRLTDVSEAEIEVTGGFLDAELAFRSETPISLAEFLPRVRTSVFPDEEQEESTDEFVGFAYERRSQRLESRISLGYAEESVVTSELLAADFPDIDLGDVVVGDSGRISVRNRRELLSAKPSLSWAWTPTRRLELGASYLDASYEEQAFEQTGYTDIGVFGGVSVDVSPRDSIEALVRVSTYEPERARADTERAAFDLEWTRRWSPTMRFYVRAGVETADTEVVALDPQRRPITVSVSETTPVGGIGAAWKYEVTEIVLDAVRSVSPSSAGVVVERDEARLRMRRDLRERFAVFGNLRNVRTKGAVEDIAQVRDRDYIAARLGFEWRATRPLRLLGAYDYAWQEFEGEPDDAVSNSISISFIYEPRRRD